MEKKLKEINVSELDANEVLEIGGGGRKGRMRRRVVGLIQYGIC